MWFLLILGSMPAVVTACVGIGFAISKPEKLQSEDYQLRQQSLQLLQGVNEPIVIDAVTAITNPKLLSPPDDDPDQGGRKGQ
jgi:hypothetical protein